MKYIQLLSVALLLALQPGDSLVLETFIFCGKCVHAESDLDDFKIPYTTESATKAAPVYKLYHNKVLIKRHLGYLKPNELRIFLRHGAIA